MKAEEIQKIRQEDHKEMERVKSSAADIPRGRMIAIQEKGRDL